MVREGEPPSLFLMVATRRSPAPTIAGPARTGKSLRFAIIMSSPMRPPGVKIFLFTGIPICGRRLPSPCRHEGRFAVVTKRGAGCDGPLPASGVVSCPSKRRRRTVKSCGPGAATLASIPACLCGPGNGGKRGRSPGRARNKPSNHCAGKVGMSWLYLSDPCALPTTNCTRRCGCRRRPTFPAPSAQRGCNETAQPGRKVCRGNAKACLS
jgi:hypothetical protein